MLKKMLVFAILAFSVGSLGAIDAPPPECYPCAAVSSR